MCRQAEDASSGDVAPSSYAARARQAAAPHSPKSGIPSRQGSVPPPSTHLPPPPEAGGTRDLTVSGGQQTDAEHGSEVLTATAVHLLPPPANAGPQRLGMQVHSWLRDRPQLFLRTISNMEHRLSRF